MESHRHGDGGQIRRTRAVGTDFRHAVLTAADMRMADLRRAKLQGAEMQDVLFEGALLEGAELLHDDCSDYRLKDPGLIEEWIRQNLEAGFGLGDSGARAFLKRLQQAIAMESRVTRGGIWSWVPRRDPDSDYRKAIHRMEAYLDMLAIASIK